MTNRQLLVFVTRTAPDLIIPATTSPPSHTHFSHFSHTLGVDAYWWIRTENFTVTQKLNSVFRVINMWNKFKKIHFKLKNRKKFFYKNRYFLGKSWHILVNWYNMTKWRSDSCSACQISLRKVLKKIFFGTAKL